MSNDFTGRILKITTTGTIPLANFKVEGGIWTGGTSTNTFSLVDVAGRQYDWNWPSSGDAVVITKLGWMSGPVSIIGTFTGEIHLYLGTR